MRKGDVQNRRGTMRTIGIDIGTTTISSVVLDVEKQVVLKAKTISNGSFLERENSWERIQDVAVIISKATAVLEELLDEYPDVTAIGLTGQMHGILYLDQNGECISPLYTWQDERGNGMLDGESYVQYAVRKTGMKASAGYGLITHFYNVKNELVPEHAAKICTIGDYLGMVLTGRKTPLVHSSNAASMGFFDLKSGKFAVRKIELLGIEEAILPQVTEEFETLGVYNGIPVSVAIGDNQASFLGAAGMEEGTVLINMGTGGQISVLSDVCFETEGIEARPLTKGKYLLVGASLCGGRAYAVLEHFFHLFAEYLTEEGIDPLYDIMEKMAKKGAVQSGGMQVCTTFNGTRFDPKQRGRIAGISEENFTPEGMTYGVLQGMAQELFDLFVQVRDGVGIEARRVVASGNGLRKNPVLQEIFCELFQRDIQMAKYTEEAACGAASVTKNGLYF